MRYYKLYYPISNNLDIDKVFVEKYEKLNYWTLEEIMCLNPDEAFTAELFWVQKNSAGQDRHSRYAAKSDALNLFIHDMVSPDSSFRKAIYPYCREANSEEAFLRTTRDEDEKGFHDRECRIITCEDMIRKLSQYTVPREDSESYLLGAQNAKGFSFKFVLPKEVPAQLFSGSDFDFFTTPKLTSYGQFRLTELGADNIYKYALASFYYELAKYCKHPEDSESRALNNYYVVLDEPTVNKLNPIKNA